MYVILITMNIERYIKDSSRNEAPFDFNEKFWGDVITRIDKNIAQKLTPQRLRAEFITSLFNIPQGWASALSYRETDKESRIKTKGSLLEESGDTLPRKSIEYLYPELDRLLRKYFLHKVSAEKFSRQTSEPFVMEDFTIQPDAEDAIRGFEFDIEHIENEEEKKFAQRILSILKGEFILTEASKEMSSFSYREDVDELLPDTLPNPEVHFHYLPGGNPLFLRGYIHDAGAWEHTYSKTLADIYHDADYVSIEASSNRSIGDTLWRSWKTNNPYSDLMRELVSDNFDGYFIETDGRNSSRFDTYSYDIVSQLSPEFYQDYFNYLKKENPAFLDGINSSDSLKKLILWHTDDVSREEREMVDVRGKKIPYLKGRGEALTKKIIPHGFSFGKMAFTDALSAIKFLTLSELMNRGEAEKGIMVDFQGAAHTIQKSFFLKYPMHAVEVILRSLPNIFAQGDSYFYQQEWGDVYSPLIVEENAKKVSEMLRKPDWVHFIYEIGRIPIFKTKKGLLKRGVNPGMFQMEMKKVGEYNLFTSLVKENENLPQLIEKIFDDEYLQKVIDKYSK